ncbi:MAG: glycosyltransferase family 4 protein [bacterium]
MKICIFSTTYFPKAGGAERFIHGLATNLKGKGHIAYVLVPYDSSLNLQSLVNYKILQIRFLGPFRNNLKMMECVLFLNLLFYFILYRFDVIQAVTLYPSGFIASLFTKIFKVPSILRPTGEDIQIYKKLNYGLRLNPFVDIRVKQALQNCSKAIAISPSIDRDLLSALGYSKKGKICPISNGIDLNKFNEKVKFDIRRDLKLGKDAKIIISIGRNHPKKDYKTLIEAVSLCSLDYHLVIVGGGEETLREFIDKKVESRIHLLGQLPKNYTNKMTSFSFPPKIVVDYLKTSDLYVSSSLIEGSPNVILEAMAAGLPIVASNSPGIWDYVKDGENGVLVTPEKPKKLARVLHSVISNKNILKKYSYASKKMSLQYSFSIVVNEYIKVYNDLVENI